MSEVFRERIQTPAPAPVQEAKPLPSDDVPVGALPAKDPETPDERILSVWEELNHKKFVHSYFEVANISHEFMVKMPTAEIDKYIRGEIEQKGLENNIDNYKRILSELEEEIGSKGMELFKRFHRITGYIRAMQKLAQARALKEKYLSKEDLRFQ